MCNEIKNGNKQLRKENSYLNNGINRRQVDETKSIWAS